MATIIVFSLIIGIVSTLVLDIWAQIQQRVAGVPAPDWGTAGRWVRGLSRGEWVLRDGTAAPSATDRTVGWLFHYGVGIVYGFFLFLIAGAAFAVHPTLIPPLIVGVIIATLAGLFIFLPGLGAGVAGAGLADQKTAIRNMLIGHLIFAVAQYLTAVCLAAIVF
ncbi:DUF2938 family protein [Salinisphaera sp. Q1T1-3]|uniref:DUF2938 family protein n=1 Tax=Salinisphaera sp. Q1T1-3 TaxID=2321229 RepID=UPI0013144344|nr:DUF2938 family protein [Salinisphaera sp. Q1T1-3]